MAKSLSYVLTVIVPAILLVFYIHHVAEVRELAMAAAEAREPVPEYKVDPVTGLQIDPMTNFIMGDGFEVMKNNCVRCHPTTIVTTFRADRDGWLGTIRWMQAEKGLQTFDEKTEGAILDYLATYYGKP